MLLVLTGVTAVSVALLAYVNELTKGPIAEANAKTLNEALKKVLPEYTNNPVAESDTVFSEKDGKKIVDFIIYPAKNGEKGGKGSDNSWGERFYCDTCVIAFIQA